ncbi:MAG: hypothetical protein R3A47_06400 [Polyangiales bacterium]
MDLDTDIELRVFVQLLNEGTVVFRPTWARPLAPSVVELLTPEDYDQDDEEWEFKPGSIVKIETRFVDGEEIYVAVRFAYL